MKKKIKDKEDYSELYIEKTITTKLSKYRNECERIKSYCCKKMRQSKAVHFDTRYKYGYIIWQYLDGTGGTREEFIDYCPFCGKKIRRTTIDKSDDLIDEMTEKRYMLVE